MLAANLISLIFSESNRKQREAFSFCIGIEEAKARPVCHPLCSNYLRKNFLP